VFDSAEDFLKTKLRSRAACLIVEVNLPNMDGIALLEHINNIGVRLPTIVLSSSSNLSEAVRAMQAEAMDFIEKPFITDTLIKKVLNVINQA
jgi:two-component system response regulator FixJ